MTIRRFGWSAARRLIYPLLPRSARLPFTYWINLLGGFIEPELQHLEALCPAGRVAIDVGANIGLFSYRLARLSRKVYAFEINDELLTDLVAYNPGNIEIVTTGLSSSEGEATLYIPVSNNLPLTGWASLSPNNYPEADAELTKSVRVSPLDAYSLRDVSFTKIDVEGHETDVLKGAINTISINRPVVLVEIKERNRSWVLSFFKDLNYMETSLERICGTAGAPENHIFLPGDSGNG